MDKLGEKCSTLKNFVTFCDWTVLLLFTMSNQIFWKHCDVWRSFWIDEEGGESCMGSPGNWRCSGNSHIWSPSHLTNASRSKFLWGIFRGYGKLEKVFFKIHQQYLTGSWIKATKLKKQTLPEANRKEQISNWYEGQGTLYFHFWALIQSICRVVHEICLILLSSFALLNWTNCLGFLAKPSAIFLALRRSPPRLWQVNVIYAAPVPPCPHKTINP